MGILALMVHEKLVVPILSSNWYLECILYCFQ
jgi:hypothetical protein